MPEPTNFTILCVCTGNVCRSPAVERLLALGLGPEVVVASAGTHALVGQPIAPPVDALLREAGADSTGFAARPLSEALLRPADLVLTMTMQQRSDVVVLWPRAVRRTFTLKEFARLLGECDPAMLPTGSVADRLRAAIPLAAARRRHLPDPDVDDVIDPYGRSDAVHAATFADIERAVARIGRILAPDERRIE